MFNVDKDPYQTRVDKRNNKATTSGINMDMDVQARCFVLLRKLIVKRLHVFILTGVCCTQDGAHKDRILI